jgi:hypothetical protein
MQLAPDDPPTGPTPDAAVRMLHAAAAAGSVYLALVAPGAVEPMVLANQAGYGLITGYAAVPAGQYEAVVSANGRERRQPVEFHGGEPMSLLLTDGPDGPVLRTLLDAPYAPATLNPPTLTMPASAAAAQKNTAKSPAIERSDGRQIAVVLCVAAIIGAAVVMARARPTRREQRNDVSRQGSVGARGHGRDVVRPARPAVDTARALKGVGRSSVPARPRQQHPRQQNSPALRQAMRGRGRGGGVVRLARPVDDTARLALEPDVTARLAVDVDATARLALDPDVTARLALDPDVTARLALDQDVTARLALDPDVTARLPAVTVKSSVPWRRR